MPHLPPSPLVHRSRLAAQLLTGPVGLPVESVTQHLVAIQAQSARGARLALRARVVDLDPAKIDRALTMDRSLVITWLNRGTLHLVAASDLAWLLAATAPRRVAENARRLAAAGVSPAAADRAVAILTDTLASNGPLARAAIRNLLDEASIPTGGDALLHLLVHASLLGAIVRGPIVNGHQAFVSTAAWLGTQRQWGHTEALGELAGRYLVAHAPATPADLAKWAGIGLTDARTAFSIAGVTAVDPATGSADVSGTPASDRVAPPKLLGPFDPLLFGWADRGPVIGQHTSLVTNNGIFREIILVGGRAVGTWSVATDDQITLTFFEQIDLADQAALELDMADVERFLRSAATH